MHGTTSTPLQLVNLNSLRGSSVTPGRTPPRCGHSTKSALFWCRNRVLSGGKRENEAIFGVPSLFHLDENQSELLGGQSYTQRLVALSPLIRLRLKLDLVSFPQ